MIDEARDRGSSEIDDDEAAKILADHMAERFRETAPSLGLVSTRPNLLPLEISSRPIFDTSGHRMDNAGSPTDSIDIYPVSI